LKADAAIASSQKNAQEAAAAPVLTAGALESMSEEERQAKEFGKDRDDFYPTERHAHPKSKADKDIHNH